MKKMKAWRICCSPWCFKKKQHAFVVFCDKPLPVFQGIKAEVVGTPVSSLLSKRWWLDVKLPAALKTFRPDLLLNITGDACLRTRIPQLLCINDTSFLNHPKQFSSAELLFLKFYVPRYLSKSKAIITSSEFVRHDILRQFDIPADKIVVIRNVLRSSGAAIDWQEREQVKDGYADGREYFLFTGGFEPLNDLVTVLKAFSRFKKWQRSNMKLLVTGNTSHSEMAEKLRSYKFRDDVIVLNDVSDEQSAKLLAAAYVHIHTPLYDANASAVIASMSAGTPVIASNTSAIPEVAGEAVLYAEAGNEEMIAAQMIALHKDEDLRGRMSENGKQQAQKYNGHDPANQLWQLIESSATG